MIASFSICVSIYTQSIYFKGELFTYCIGGSDLRNSHAPIGASETVLAIRTEWICQKLAQDFYLNNDQCLLHKSNFDSSPLPVDKSSAGRHRTVHMRHKPHASSESG